MNGAEVSVRRPLVLACGALAADLRAVLGASGFDAHVDVEYLPANLHNRPDSIPPALRPHLVAAADIGRPVFVAYADCGTGGGLDALLREFPGVQRLPGALGRLGCLDIGFGEVERFVGLRCRSRLSARCRRQRRFRQVGGVGDRLGP